jgi:hypothetical protein
MGQQNDKACEDIYSEIVGERKRNDIKLLDSIPAADFFVYLDIKQEFLFHGSNQLDLDILVPGKKGNFRGEEVKGFLQPATGYGQCFLPLKIEKSIPVRYATHASLFPFLVGYMSGPFFLH